MAPRSRKHLSRGVVLAVVLSIGGVALASGLALRWLTRTAISRIAIHETRSFATILGYEIMRNYELTDERGLAGFLAGVSSRRPEIVHMRIADRSGRVVASLDNKDLGRTLTESQGLWRALEGKPAEPVLTGTNQDQVEVWVPLVVGAATTAPRGALLVEQSQAELSLYFLRVVQTNSVLLAVTALLTALGLYWYLETRVVRRLRKLAVVARGVAARDLTGLDNLVDDSGDELADLSSAFVSLGGTMLDLVTRLRAIGRAIDSASEKVGTTSRELHQSASGQRELAESAAQRLELHLHTLAELGQTARESVDRADQSGRDAHEISAAANELVDVAARTNQAVELGVRGISEVATALRRILAEADHVEKSTVTARQQADLVFQTSDTLRHESRESARLAQTLADAASGSASAVMLVRSHASDIDQHIATVDTHIQILNPALEAIVRTANDVGEIADQTRVLALNASILAARAGEAGAGFRVVASRVRDLATSTRDSARSIAELASSIEETAPAVLSSVGITRTRVREMVAESDRAKVSLEAILGEADSLRGATGRMESASSAQAESAKQLLGTATDTAQRVERLSHAAELQREATERLERSGQSLRDAAIAIDSRAHQQEQLATGIAAAAARDAERLRTLGETALSGVSSSQAAKQATAQIVAVSGRHATDVAGFERVVGTIAHEATVLRDEVARFRLPQ